MEDPALMNSSFLLITTHPPHKSFNLSFFLKRDYTYRVKNQEISPKRIQQSCESPIFPSFTVCVFITVEKHSLRRENSNQ